MSCTVDRCGLNVDVVTGWSTQAIRYSSPVSFIETENVDAVRQLLLLVRAAAVKPAEHVLSTGICSTMFIMTGWRSLLMQSREGLKALCFDAKMFWVYPLESPARGSPYIEQVVTVESTENLEFEILL